LLLLTFVPTCVLVWFVYHHHALASAPVLLIMIAA
jgi:hypothetical protein